MAERTPPIEKLQAIWPQIPRTLRLVWNRARRETLLLGVSTLASAACAWARVAGYARPRRP